MKNAIAIAIALVMAPFKPKSVAQIIDGVNKNIDELMTAAQRHADAAVNAEAKAYEMHRKANGERLAAQQAERIANRLVALID